MSTKQLMPDSSSMTFFTSVQDFIWINSGFVGLHWISISCHGTRCPNWMHIVTLFTYILRCCQSYTSQPTADMNTSISSHKHSSLLSVSFLQSPIDYKSSAAQLPTTTTGTRVDSFIGTNLIHNFYINYIKLSSSTCFECHPLIFRRSMMLTVHVCSLWYSHSLQVAVLCTC